MRYILERIEAIFENAEKVRCFENRMNDHISGVQKYAKKLVDKLPEYSDLIEIASRHDESKFLDPEREAFIELVWKHTHENFDKEGYQSPGQITDDLINEATIHHITTNKHHPEYWSDDEANIDPNDRDKSLKCIDASKMPDIYIAEMCFTGDTKIPLLNGKTARIDSLVNEDEFWVYSCTKDGRIVPGKARNARITKSVDKLLKITLDNGEEVKCTHDHRFMLRDGSYKEAHNLSIGESLMPLYRRMSRGNINDYEEVYVPKINKYKMTHRVFVEEYFGGYSKYVKKYKTNHVVCHHLDFDKLNNSPDNLKIMSHIEHQKYHVDQQREIGSRVFKELWKDLDFRERARKRSSKTGLITGRKNMIKYNKSKTHRDVARKNMIKKNKIKVICPICNKQLANEGKLGSHMKHVHDNQDYFFSQYNKERWKNKDFRKKMSKAASERLKQKATCSICNKEFSNKLLLGIHMKKEHQVIKNHKVIRIEEICDQIDVYDITVDKYHNFALNAGVFVHNCCDWSEMGEQFGNTARDWFDKQKNVRWSFSKEQEQLIEKLLRVIEQ